MQYFQWFSSNFYCFKQTLINITIDKYTDLQRIKIANGNNANTELDYQIKITTAKLATLGVNVEDITL